MRFGELLISRRLVTEDTLAEGLEVQRFRRDKVGRILRDLGHLNQPELNQALGDFFRTRNPLPTIQDLASDLKKQESHGLDYSAIRHWARSWDVLFLAKDADQKLVFLSSRFRDEVIEAGERQFGCSCRILVVPEDAIAFLQSAAGLSSKTTLSSLRIENGLTDDQKASASDPYTALYRDTIQEAKSLKASDIHIQPTRDGIEVRLRVNGELLTWKKLSIEHRKSFINRVKQLTNLSIAMSGRSQDARISYDSWQLDLRVSLIPSQFGEKIVLRLLDLTRQFDLNSLGFDSKTFQDLQKALRTKNGVLIVSGPTGSGKTTTLYTLLCSLDRVSQNVLTLEDPIEYTIPGLTQVAITRSLSFADALRSVLRQDPDVILVGEIRDSETADLCIKAASTGHLVLTTLHANGAREVIQRLMTLGIDPHVLKSVLRFSSAQRLVKTLCPSCSLAVSFETAVQELGNRNLPQDQMDKSQFRTRNGAGCPSCRSGITGRIPILEYMMASEIGLHLGNPNIDCPDLTVSLRDACLMRAQKGEIDFREALYV